MRSTAAALAVVVACLLAAACGSDDDADGDGARLTKTAFIAKADAICQEANDRIDAIPEPQTTEELAQLGRQVLDIAREQLARLQALRPLHPEIAAIATGSFRHKQPPQIQGSGYVVHSLEAALWAFHDAQDYREAVLRAVNLGDDADTTGAVCGQLAGACFGEYGIPHEWRSRLGGDALIEGILKRLFEQP